MQQGGGQMDKQEATFTIPAAKCGIVIGRGKLYCFELLIICINYKFIQLTRFENLNFRSFIHW